MPWKVFTQSLALTNFGDKQGYVNVETGEVVKGRGLRYHHALQRLYLCGMCPISKNRGLAVCHQNVPRTSGRRSIFIISISFIGEVCHTLRAKQSCTSI